MTLSLSKQGSLLERIEQDMQRYVSAILTEYRQRLELAATTVKYVDPRNVLKRGYSITRLNGKAVKDITELSSGDCLETLLAGGTVKSVVIDNN